jgi:succinate dehydrogenase membrane anchor subunit
MTQPQMRTPLSRVRGLGSARTGTQTFWHQRITSLAGVLLTIALVIVVISILGRSHAAVVQILGSPLVAIILILFVINMAYHMWIGMQEILVDYVHEEKLKLLVLMGNTFYAFAIAFACCFAILKLSFGV